MEHQHIVLVLCSQYQPWHLEYWFK